MIWIVDDNEGILEVIEIILQEEGYHTKSISTGNHLMKALEQENPRMILLDVLLSGMDGREICRNLKDSEKTRDIPVIIMSANTKVDTQAQQARADGYLQKPFEIIELIETVKKYL